MGKEVCWRLLGKKFWGKLEGGTRKDVISSGFSAVAVSVWCLDFCSHPETMRGLSLETDASSAEQDDGKVWVAHKVIEPQDEPVPGGPESVLSGM